MKKIKHAISIRQPWVELILRGEKKAEYRSRATKIKGAVYVYASLTPAEWPGPIWSRLKAVPGDLPTGKIVGVVEITGCEPDGNGGYAYALRNPRRLSRAITPHNQPQPLFWRPQI